MIFSRLGNKSGPVAANVYILGAVLGLMFCLGLEAQVPQLINYQGRVSVDNTPFEGSGQFKFALVNGDGSTSYWSNDGTSVNGSAPAAYVNLNVARGLYSVLLGDTTIPNMAAISPSTFANSDVRLRVWFNDGVNGFEQLTPDQRIAAVAYAMMANDVADGAVTSAKLAAGSVTSAKIATGAIGAAQIANNTITSAQLAPGAASANLVASGSAGVASGGVVLSLMENNLALQAAGYVRLTGRILVAGETWGNCYQSPDVRSGHTGVWTGREMIIWGGVSSTVLNDGGRYDPLTSIWTPIPNTLANTPAARNNHTAIWTGSEMIVWGGDANGSAPGDGGRYNPAANIWIPIPNTLANTPSDRYFHTAVWTGSEMIVWGGRDVNYNLFNDGGRYNPTANSWTPIPNTLPNTPAPRCEHTAIWTGTEMIVWAGTGSPWNGGRYNPAANSWTTIPQRNGITPSFRTRHTAVWTGEEMIIWGGSRPPGNATPQNDGGRYNPVNDSWIAIPNTLDNTPSERCLHSAVWTGTEMIIWGGFCSGPFNGGGRYNPAANSWTPIDNALDNTPDTHNRHSTVWTGKEMIVWGGMAPSYSNDGGRYNPASNIWTPLPHTPPGRNSHTAAWTGSEMIVWGGVTWGMNEGGRYNPVTSTWIAIPLSLANTPSQRSSHSAIWTGSEMIIWGGYSYDVVNDGGRYNPAINNWTTIPRTLANTPNARASHKAIWTGSEMIVWGGRDIDYHFLNDGGQYNPAANSWISIPSTLPNTPTARSDHTAVWTGNEMIIWGGVYYSNDGGRYDPIANAWTPIVPTLLNTPAPRYGHTAVWTGNEMIIWGGGAFSSDSRIDDGGRYNPADNSWTIIPSTLNNTPSPRQYHTAIWTGSEMIVWGGSANGSDIGDGGRFNPANNVWTPIPNTLPNSPIPRSGHTAVWTGNAMIVYGGYHEGIYLNSACTYTPDQNIFLYMKP